MNTQEFSPKTGYHIQEIDASYCHKDFLQVKQGIFVLCTSGEAEFEINMVKMQIKQNCVAMLSSILAMRLISTSADFKAIVLIIDAEMSSEIKAAADWQMLEGLMNVALAYCNKNTLSPFSQEIVGGITRCLFLIYGEDVVATDKAEQKMVYTMGDNYFRRFVELLQTHVKHEHEVSFYAEQLHITPKYLGEVCKHKSGHKAKDIISFMLLTNIKRDVILSGKSIKTIAYEYNFADQSSFGKFFKKMTGISPLVFKKGSHSDFYE